MKSNNNHGAFMLYSKYFGEQEDNDLSVAERDLAGKGIYAILGKAVYDRSENVVSYKTGLFFSGSFCRPSQMDNQINIGGSYDSSNPFNSGDYSRKFFGGANSRIC